MKQDKVSRRVTLLHTLKALLHQKELYTLEIGVAQGDFSAAIIQYLEPYAHTMVDPWVVEDDENRSNWWVGSSQAQATSTYMKLNKLYEEGNHEVIRNYSFESLLDFNIQEYEYELIYIDGDHHSEAVYLDLMLSWPLIPKGGILAGDDYNWVSQQTGQQEVKHAVDKFARHIGKTPAIIKGDEGGLDQYLFVKE